MRIIQTTKILMMFSVAAVGLAAVGCDSTTTCADGGVCPDAGAGGTGHGGSTGAGGAAGGSAGTAFGISTGTYCFDITTATPISDGCGLFDPAHPFEGTRLPVTYTTDGVTGQLTVGKMGSLGTGLISHNQGTLMRENDPIDSMMPLCMWHQTDDTVIQLTATNAFTASVTETESAFAAACAQPASADPCTSTFTFTLAIHAPALMPDATGACP
jgi:hypothetical protein